MTTFVRTDTMVYTLIQWRILAVYDC